MMNFFKGIAAAVVLSVCAYGGSASAFTSFQMFDHPDGAASSESYGLRLDSSDGDPNTPGRFFSFSGPGASTFLDFDETAPSAVIRGTTVESLSGSFGDVFDITYSFTGVVVTGDGFTATGGSGLLTNQSDASDVISLGFEQDGDGFAFLFNGHRLKGDKTSPVGTGWVCVNLDGECVGGNYNDFLFTAKVIPLPAPVLLLAAALAGFGFLGVRRRMTAA